jgi:hypothetical protein
MEHLICQPIQAASMYHCRTYIDYMYEEGDNLSNGLSFRSLNKWRLIGNEMKLW